MLIQAVVAFTAGIAFAAYTAQEAVFLFIAFFLLLIATFFCWHRKNALQLPLLLLIWFVCGLLQGPSLKPPTHDDSLYQLFAAGREVTLAGTLLQAPAISSDTTRLLMRTDAYLAPHLLAAAAGQEQTASIREQPLPQFKPAQGKISLTLKGPPPGNIRPGQRMLVRTFVSRSPQLTNPGGFDYQKFLAGKSIWVTGWISSPAHIAIQPIDSTLPHKLRYLPEQLRQQINHFLTTHLPPGQSSLYKAILTGDRAAISITTLENFKASGAMHLLAISGLHMGLIALGIGAVINWLIKRSTWLLIHTSAWKTAVYLILPILGGYAFIAGLQTPVLRSFIMTAVFLLAVLFDRQWHIPTNIALAALIILLLNPASLYTVSFQLSFAAVIAMAAIMPAMTPLIRQPDSIEREHHQPLFARVGMIVKIGFVLSLTALAGTLPLLLYYFNRFSPLSVFSTLLLEPLLCFWALPLGLVSVPFIFFAPGFAQVLLTCGAMGISIADRLCAWLAALPLSSIWLSTPSPLEIICYYVFLFSLVFIKKSHTAMIAAVVSIALLLSSAGYMSYLGHSPRTDTVTVLDVGQGNAVVVELAGGFTALIDGGGSSSPRFNVGEKVIAPFLWNKRISHLDAIIISHPDADHYNGLDFVIKRFRPHTLWVNGDSSGNDSYSKLLARAASQGVTVHAPRIGETLFANSQSRFFNVGDFHLTDGNISENEKSLVMRLDSHGKNFLFTGDIGEYVERKITEGHQEIHADVLLLPHHGSNSSSSSLFLSAIRPQYVVISAGRNKSPLFPAPEVINRCRSVGSIIYDTAQDGAISFTVQQDGALSVRTTLTHR